MQITDLLLASSIQLHQTATDKTQVFDTLISMLEQGGYLADADAFKADILARANAGIAIEKGLALPHAKSSAVKKAGLAAITLTEGVDCNAMDGKPSDLFFMIACPEDEGLHLQILSTLCETLMHPDFRMALRNAETPEAFLAVIGSANNKAPAAPAKPQDKVCRVLAVTSCPIGIAHTYMAAEALENAAAKRGAFIKVETNGSVGINNPLTADEIKAADGIIVAADTSVELRRFAGKPVVFVPVAEAIRRPEALIATVQTGEAPIYSIDTPEPEAPEAAEPTAKRTLKHTLYTHLMTGFSHALPLLVTCGVLWGLCLKVSALSVESSLLDLTLLLLVLLADATVRLAPVALSGFIAMSIADRPGLVIGLVAGSISSLNVASLFPLAQGQMQPGFLGALGAGFVAGYLARGLGRLFDRLPKSIEGLNPVFFLPVTGSLLAGALVFPLDIVFSLVNGYLFQLLNALPLVAVVVLAAVLAGMLAVDFGGPCNKASYIITLGLLFTEMITRPNSDSVATHLMAAVLLGGMVPPLAAGLSALFLPKCFTAQQRQKAPSSCVAGLCFITEGAMPYLEENSVGIRAGCVAGSAVAGALSAAFGCSITVPHGGIFVLWLSNHPVLYLEALCAGSLTGMLVIAVAKLRHLKKHDTMG